MSNSFFLCVTLPHAFQTVSLSLVSIPLFAKQILLNALLVFCAWPTLDSNSWSYLCGPAFTDPKCSYCWVIPMLRHPKTGCSVLIFWVPVLRKSFTIAAPATFNCKSTSVFPTLQKLFLNCPRHVYTWVLSSLGWPLSRPDQNRQVKERRNW